MKICPKCGTEHDKDGDFCSRSCANGRKHSDDTKNNISNGVRNYLNNLTDKEKEELANRSRVSVKFAAAVTHANQQKRLEESSFEDLTWERKRIKVLEEQEHKCARCGLNDWLGQAITLDIDHKDGDRKNNSRENLEALCPNCHSQTETFRGKNKNSSRKVSDEDLIIALKENPTSISQALDSVNLAPKGGNYKRAKKLLNSSVELIDLYKGYAKIATL
jgi:Zn finger protein HypA/HybF involved in hydrogenase expression